MGCGIEDHEVHDGENVKEACRLGEPPMWHITLPVSKGGSHEKMRLAWIGLLHVCGNDVSGYYWWNSLGAECGDVGLPWQESTSMSLRGWVLW